MKKTLTYDYEMMVRAGQLLNSLTFTGVQQARIVSELANILDSGKTGEIFERKDDEKNGVHSKEIQSDKLEK
jgi:hypothetical protein